MFLPYKIPGKSQSNNQKWRRRRRNSRSRAERRHERRALELPPPLASGGAAHGQDISPVPDRIRRGPAGTEIGDPVSARGGL
eukprot:scaffold19723_cov97-Phaeocystis_antarctica.AAC.4